MRAGRLNKAWNVRCASTAIDAVMRFSDAGLVLGAGTLLAKRDPSDAGLRVDPRDERLQVLLAAAHGKRPPPEALIHLSKAAERWNEGQEALATMHLALSRLDRLAQPESDAHRLFLADGMLEDGFEGDTISKAILTRGTDLRGLEKYDPDQPRVPAGSGLTSGEWTSTGNSSSEGSSQDVGQPAASSPGATGPGASGSLQSLVYRPGIDPAPIFTEVTVPPIVSLEACKIAYSDCVDAAVEVARNDGENAVSHFITLASCKEANLACDMLSWTIEDLPFVAETGQGGGVRFPHGGVVVITKGRLDRYFPPYAIGRPSFRRSTGVGAESDQGKVLRVEGNLCPQWRVPPDETIVSSPAGFSPCRKMIGLLTARMDAEIIERVCSHSKQWGKIIRAKIAFKSEGRLCTALVTCWSSTDSGMRIFVKLDGCCGNGAACP
jgi:hypothetical protein